MIRLLILTLFLTPLALAQSCIDQLPEAFNSNVIKDAVGVIYFNIATANEKQGYIVFSGGVCVEGKEGWQLLTEHIEVTPLPEARAENVTVKFQSWQLQADFLQASPAGLTMQGITFFGDGIEGLAKEASYDFTTQEIRLLEASTSGKNLRINGQAARLVDDKVFFENIEATTCNCETAPLYTLKAEQATLEISGQKLLIAKGTLNILGLPLALKDLEVSPEAIEKFQFPIVIEYIPDTSDSEGTGLGLRIPSLRIDPTLDLELGIAGLDDIYPPRGLLLAHYKDNLHTFDVGYAAEGFQADFLVKQPLSPNVKAVFGIHNRDWKSQDYLHEGYLGIESTSSWQWEKQKLSFSSTTLAAISSQTLEITPFHDGRLVTSNTLAYQLPFAGGNFSIALKTSLGYYPISDQLQWGLNLTPSWQYQTGPFNVQIAYVQQWTNSASPFSTKLDKLEPKSQLSVSTSIKGNLSTSLMGEFGSQFRYNFLETYAVDVLSVRGQLNWRINEVILSPYITADFAPWLNPDLDTDGYIKAGFDATAPRWETGTSATFDQDLQLSKLEFRTAFPVDFKDISLKPFISIDVIPTLTTLAFPRISGHGVELTWRSCCGTISLGYRQENNQFKTLIGFSLE